MLAKLGLLSLLLCPLFLATSYAHAAEEETEEAVVAPKKPAKKPAKKAKMRVEETEEVEEEGGYEQRRYRRKEEYSVGRSSRGQVGVELLGSGLLYSIMGSYLVTDNIALNGGFSYYSISATSGSTSASVGVGIIPISGSYLFGGPDHHFEVLGGGAILIASASVSGDNISDRASGQGFVPQIGMGYRYWPAEGGFHFRATLYGMFIPDFFQIWPGVSVGYAF